MSRLQASTSRSHCAMIARIFAGFTCAIIIAFLARRRGALNSHGSVAAVILGTVAMGAGIGFGLLLVFYFVASTLLSSWRRADKRALTASIVEKTDARDARQVVANGSVYALSALVAAVTHSDVMTAAALGALAASMADTSATEVGSAIGGEPRALFSWRRVPTGTSGALTLAGTLAMVAASFLLGIVSLLLGFSAAAARAAIVAGIIGAMADSLLGSTVQERRRCLACGTRTERRRHNCHPAGVDTEVVGGVRGLDNDWVNLTSTVIGALAAAFSRGGV